MGIALGQSWVPKTGNPGKWTSVNMYANKCGSYMGNETGTGCWGISTAIDTVPWNMGNMGEIHAGLSVFRSPAKSD